MHGYELQEILSKEFEDDAVADYPIFVLDKNTGSISEIIGVTVELTDDGEPVYTTWIEVEEM